MTDGGNALDKKIETIEEYIEACPQENREILYKLRSTIKEAAPDAKEKISWQMPTYSLNGDLVYFGAFKKHIGFFPTASGVEAFKEELKGYKTFKGTIHFLYSEPLPCELIKKIVSFRSEENKQIAEEKRLNKKNSKER